MVTVTMAPTGTEAGFEAGDTETGGQAGWERVGQTQATGYYLFMVLGLELTA
jgi:hypothetical protein